jgi:hypothetical protein
MVDFLGHNIAKIINDGLQAAGGVFDATLIKVSVGTRTPGSLTDGTNPTTVSHAAKGFIETRTERRLGGTLVAVGGKFVTLLGDSMPSGVEPAEGDRVTIEGSTYDVVEVVDRDPAGALFKLRVQV